jgi:hypothetical protein
MNYNVNVTQKNLYQQYANIGIEVAKILDNDDIEFAHRAGWKVLCIDGFWKLFISEKIVENNVPCENGISSLQGFTTTCKDNKFHSFLIDQLSIIYFVSRFGSKEEQKNYIPVLTKGGVGTLFFDKSFNAYINSRLPAKNNFSLHLIKNTNLAISSFKSDVDIFVESIEIKDRENPEKSTSTFCELLKFKRFLYSILLSIYSTSVNSKCIKLLDTFYYDPLRKDA